MELFVFVRMGGQLQNMRVSSIVPRQLSLSEALASFDASKALCHVRCATRLERLNTSAPLR